MHHLESALAEWERTLCREVEIGSLFSRNPIVHKWKAPARSVMLREALGWRTHDLLKQATALLKLGHVLGCRILVRSAFESIALLSYLNQQMRKVVAGELSFHDFSDRTSQLMLGSKDKSTLHESVNIITVIGHVDKRFPGIKQMYAALSESAHPNYEGTAHGYGELDVQEYRTTFRNRWAERYREGAPSFIEGAIRIFYSEYNEEWIAAFEALEDWVETNDSQLQPRTSDA